MKTNADAIIFHTAICAGASQISLDGRVEIAFANFYSPHRIRSRMEIIMKKVITLATALMLFVGVLTGCGAGDAPKETTTGSNQTGNSQTVSTDGSTSMEKVIGFLSEAYMEENGDIKVTYNPTGSSSGIQAVSEGRCDIGLASRDLKDEEKAELTGTVVAIDGIGIIVNPDNPVTDLSIEQVAKIYTGEIANWKEVGGNDAPIVCIGREAASGTRDGFEEVTDTKDKCKYSQELTSTGDVVQTVSGNPNAIGYASVASVNESVKAVSIEGVTPTTESIQNGAYKIQRNFVLITKKDTPLSKAAQEFFDFATSEKADRLIAEAGAVPVKR